MLEEEGSHSQSFDLPAVLQPASQSQSQTREGGRERDERRMAGEKKQKGIDERGRQTASASPISDWRGLFSFPHHEKAAPAPALTELERRKEGWKEAGSKGFPLISNRFLEKPFKVPFSGHPSPPAACAASI